MKIKFVEIAGFRGFKDRTLFEFPGGFAVLTGRNGVGKSSVLDAIDFVLTGTINKFAIKSAKGGGSRITSGGWERELLRASTFPSDLLMEMVKNM